MYAEIIIPLFPLGVVLLPEVFLPLHIFEERYKSMISECLAEHKEFGIVYFSGSEMKKVGCSAQILKVLRRYENGEMDIMTVGKNRFFIKEIYETKAYLEARVVHFDDEPEEENEELRPLATRGIKYLRELQTVLRAKWDGRPLAHVDAKRISFLISGNDGFTLAEKQRLLEMTSTRKRLEDSIAALQKVIHRAWLTQEIEEIISGNGDLKKALEKYGIEENGSGKSDGE